MKQQKWKSKSFALLLAVMMLFTMMPQMVFADEQAVAPVSAAESALSCQVLQN